MPPHHTTDEICCCYIIIIWYCNCSVTVDRLITGTGGGKPTLSFGQQIQPDLSQPGIKFGPPTGTDVVYHPTGYLWWFKVDKEQTITCLFLEGVLFRSNGSHLAHNLLTSPLQSSARGLRLCGLPLQLRHTGNTKFYVNNIKYRFSGHKFVNLRVNLQQCWTHTICSLYRYAMWHLKLRGSVT